MLPKKFRLTRGFKKILRNGFFFSNSIFSVKFLPNYPEKTFRAAVFSQKKIWKKAVDRNLIKRRIFSIISNYKEKPETSVIFFPKKKIFTKKHLEIDNEISNFLRFLLLNNYKIAI